MVYLTNEQFKALCTDLQMTRKSNELMADAIKELQTIAIATEAAVYEIQNVLIGRRVA